MGYHYGLGDRPGRPDPADNGRTGKALSQMDTVFVVGTSAFTIQPGEDSSEGHMKVTITRDDRLQWTYRHASWRPLAVGCGKGTGYVWSARDLVILPDDHDDDPSVLTVDEDLLFVFKTENGWLLVCETSVRLLIGREEQSRVELGDVVERAHWSDGQLHVEDARGMMTAISIVDGRLTF
jgi:hypothetical protein